MASKRQISWEDVCAVAVLEVVAAAASTTRQQQVVVAEVPDRRKSLTESDEGSCGADQGSGGDIVPVVVLVDGHGASNEDSAKDGCEEQGHRPQRWVVCAHDLELGVEVQCQKDETCEGGCGVARRHRLERVVNLVLVARAHRPVVIYIVESGSGLCSRWYDGLADGEEVRPQAADECLDKHLEERSGDE